MGSEVTFDGSDLHLERSCGREGSLEGSVDGSREGGGHGGKGESSKKEDADLDQLAVK